MTFPLDDYCHFMDMKQVLCILCNTVMLRVLTVAKSVIVEALLYRRRSAGAKKPTERRGSLLVIIIIIIIIISNGNGITNSLYHMIFVYICSCIFL